MFELTDSDLWTDFFANTFGRQFNLNSDGKKTFINAWDDEMEKMVVVQAEIPYEPGLNGKFSLYMTKDLGLLKPTKIYSDDKTVTFTNQEGSFIEYKKYENELTIHTIPWNMNFIVPRSKLLMIPGNFQIMIKDGDVYAQVGDELTSFRSGILLNKGSHSSIKPQKFKYSINSLLKITAGMTDVNLSHHNNGVLGIVKETDWATYRYYIRGSYY